MAEAPGDAFNSFQLPCNYAGRASAQDLTRHYEGHQTTRSGRPWINACAEDPARGRKAPSHRGPGAEASLATLQGSGCRAPHPL